LKISNDGIETISLASSGQLECTGITEYPKGVIWACTSEAGVYRIEKGEVKQFSTNQGMASDFNYGIIPDAAGNIWVAHRDALSRISAKNETIRIYDHRSGIRGKIGANALSKDPSDFLWIGTEFGAIRYDIKKDLSKRVPPIVNLKNVWINGVRYGANKKIELPYGNYRIRFEYTGISFRNKDEITYQYMLEGHEDAFSPGTIEDFASYGRLYDGDYFFKVIATNGQGISSDTKATIQIVIAAPYWKETWFFVLVTLVGVLLVYFVVRMRTRRLEKAKLKLENQLEIKTREVVENASRIASINKDLTDSINYAERIQKAILPSEKRLSEPLPGSFLFFQPRDIVSGDFYFIQQFDNKLIVACADCTGHGVPGALVSMIGSVILRNIYTSQKTISKTPDQVLEQLDHDTKVALHKGFESDLKGYLNRDGMDIALAEIDLDTNEVLIASAKRHWIVFADGKQETYKGDSRSIGDLEGGDTPFSLHRFKMEKGSAMYLFSDGYTDQFGGEQDKKFKLSGTRKTIQEMNDSNADQYKAVSDAFYAWKGDTEQVDDVLFIGLRF
jgi:serine phosphatase RsbU (regulator of sigma subunit)